MSISKNESNYYGDSSILNKLLNVFIAALMFGFGWHIRGSGTGDPIIPMLFFLLFVGFLFKERKKFNIITFGLIVLFLRIMRRGWGTFVGQAGIPGLSSGKLASFTEGYSITVPWWQGYFWLFIVGLAWSGLAALILGGYNFSKKKYRVKDFIIIIILFAVGFGIGLLISIEVIPILSPDAYNKIYVTGISERNYISMRDNFAFALANVPVFLYIYFIKKDKYFVKISLIIMIIFGIGLSVADVWQWWGRNPEFGAPIGLPFWSLWEYFSGFIIGGLLMAFFYLIPKERWKESDFEIGFFPADTKLKKFLLFLIGHVALYLYAIAESANGGITHALTQLGYKIEGNTAIAIFIILLIDIPLYLLYQRGAFGQKFKKKEFSQKCIIILLILVPYFYLMYVLQFIVAGEYINVWLLETNYIVTWMDTISVIIIEIYLIFLYIKHKRR